MTGKVFSNIYEVEDHDVSVLNISSLLNVMKGVIIHETEGDGKYMKGDMKTQSQGKQQ